MLSANKDDESKDFLECFSLLNPNSSPNPPNFPFLSSTGCLFDLKKVDQEFINTRVKQLENTIFTHRYDLFSLGESSVLVDIITPNYDTLLSFKQIQVTFELDLHDCLDEEMEMILNIYKFLENLCRLGLQSVLDLNSSGQVYPTTDDYLSLFIHLSSGCDPRTFPFDKSYIKPIYKSQLALLIKSKQLDNLVDLDKLVLEGGIEILQVLLESEESNLETIKPKLIQRIYSKFLKSLIPLSFGTEKVLDSVLADYYKSHSTDEPFKSTLMLKKFDQEARQTLDLCKVLKPVRISCKWGDGNVQKAFLMKCYGENVVLILGSEFDEEGIIQKQYYCLSRKVL